VPIATVEEFAESTEFERLVLDRLMPLYSSDSSDEIDLRQAIAGTGPVKIRITGSTFVFGQAAGEQLEVILPLLFGAAWKVLDLLVEVLLQRGCRPSRGNWTIKDKTVAVLEGLADWSLLGGDQPLCAALTDLYVATTEHRHCLVHRLTSFAQQSLTLTGVDSRGNPLRSLCREELQAFVRAAQVAARSVINGGLRTREADHLRYELDQLRLHTGHMPLGGAKAGRPEIVRMVLVPEGGLHVADFAYVCPSARKRSPGGGHFDLWIDIPEDPSRQLFARMEDVPEQKVRIDLSKLPPYLAWR